MSYGLALWRTGRISIPIETVEGRNGQTQEQTGGGWEELNFNEHP